MLRGVRIGPELRQPLLQNREVVVLRPAAGRRAQDDYFTILQQWLAQFRTYPDAAKHQGWEGVVELSFSIDSRGSIRGATMTRSSGVALLDNAAFELLDRASPLPPPPADDAPLRVTVPVAYRLGVP